jgi:hypothetical protein
MNIQLRQHRNAATRTVDKPQILELKPGNTARSDSHRGPAKGHRGTGLKCVADQAVHPRFNLGYGPDGQMHRPSFQAQCHHCNKQNKGHEPK